MSASEV